LDNDETVSDNDDDDDDELIIQSIHNLNYYNSSMLSSFVTLLCLFNKWESIKHNNRNTMNNIYNMI